MGVGKSDVVKQTGQRLELEVKDVRAVLLDPTDLKGLPIVSDGKAKWAIPDFLPRKGSGILFLDELNRAPALVQNACFQLVLDRKLGDYSLPEGWSVVAACNPSGGGVTRMPDALANRFVHLDVEPDLNDWCLWANQPKSNIEPIVIAFLRFRPELLHKFDPKLNEKAFPTPRSWEFVSKITASHPGDRIELGLYTGAVGNGAATEYASFLRLYRELPSIDQILLNPQTAPVPTQAATLYAVSSAMARRANDSNFSRVITYTNRLPKEYAVMVMKDASQRDKALASTKEFTKWAVDNHEIFS
jgi:MoxR-like ATPase